MKSVFGVSLVVALAIPAAHAFTSSLSTVAMRSLATTRGPKQHGSIRMNADMAAPTAVFDNDNDDKTNGSRLFEGFGVGIKRDYTRRLPLYKSDITDGLNVQVSQDLIHWMFLSLLNDQIDTHTLFCCCRC